MRPWYSPGAPMSVAITIEGPPGLAETRLELLDGARVVDSVLRRFRLAEGRSARRLALTLPTVGRHGYGLRLQLATSAGDTEAHSAIEALVGWWESPRHAALTRFEPGLAPGGYVARLRRWHVTVAQFYDWMYRHYRYRPPGGRGEFIDPLGRRVSHAVVRHAVRQCRRQGIASLAYGSVYGAEREYIERHPEQLLRNRAGEPLSLGGTFFITDLRPGPWRHRLMREFERACRSFGFDGVHMDQYGEPHEGWAADGTLVELEQEYAGLIEEAAERLRALDPPRRVLFNCVGGWPLERVAGAPSAATYIEIWPPDTTYGDVVDRIDEARRLSPEKQVVIAAYPSVLARHARDLGIDPVVAEAPLLLTAIIQAAGAYHHVLADDDRIITGGYYPDATSLPARHVDELRLAWEFSARHVHLISDPRSTRVSIRGLSIEAAGRRLPVAETPTAGSVWTRAERSADRRVTLHLVDLLEQPSDEWDSLRSEPRQRIDWRVRWPLLGRDAWFASPWSDHGAAEELRASGGGMALPEFRRWGMLVTSQEAGDQAFGR